jgi:hypothetical protein
MMGPEKLSTMRAKLMDAFALSEDDFLAFLNRLIKEREQTPKENRTAIDTLRLLRDALITEAKKSPTSRRNRTASSRKR